MEDIGTLRAKLIGDVTVFKDNFLEAQSVLSRFAQEVSKQLANVEQTIRKVGTGLTVGITAPFAAMTVASSRGAGGFEAAMNRVQAALKGISAEQLKEISKQARLMGPEVGRSAIEAADGVETLALAGMNAQSILGGGLKQTLLLAGANMADLESAGAAVTDVLAQFGKVSSELPPIVNQITGALDSSKFGFQDFKDAIAQAGGVAGAAGVSFEDFATSIAATSALFASGSDAGTSFKTFITSLNPKSEDAARVMEQLGLKFFDATGKMKDMAEIAGMLRKALSGLSERSRTEALTKMFGTDAMRTAIGLMQQGKKGFEELQATINKGDAQSKLAIQMQGYEASVKRLSAAFEALKVSIGETGLLNAFTSFTTSLGGMVNGIAQANPALLKIGVGLWAAAAAVGPLTLAVLTIVKLALPLFIARLGFVGMALAALVNPIGVLAALLLKLAVVLTGASSAATLLATRFAAMAGPIGLVVTALGLVYMWSGKAAQANAGLQKSSDLASKALALQQEQSLGLAAATGEARKALLQKMQADRAVAAQALVTARNELIAAKASLFRAQATANLNRERMKVAANDPRMMVGAGAQIGKQLVEQADVNWRSSLDTVKKLTAAVEGYNSTIANAGSSANVSPVNMDFGKPDAANKVKPSGASASGPSTEDLARRREELQLQQMLNVASARGDIEEERRIQQLIDLKRREQEYEDAGLKPAMAKVAAARDMVDLQVARTAGIAEEIALEEKSTDLQAAEIRGDHEIIRLRENELYIAERVKFWRSKELDVQAAQIAAAEDLANLEAARLDMAERLSAERARDRELELARMRGDSEGTLRQIERRNEMERRAQQIYDQSDGRLNRAEASEQASFELSQEDQARAQGQFRDMFKGGFHAALEGDFKGWFKNWMAERTTKALEDALNNVADMLFKVFGSALGQAGGSGGGGFFGSLLSGASALFGGGATPAVGAAGTGNWYTGFPGFNTGGSFKVGGTGGPDSQLFNLRLTPGEMVDIRRPGQSGGITVSMPITLNAPGADPAQLARLQAQLAEMDRGLPSRIVSTVADARQRGMNV